MTMMTRSKVLISAREEELLFFLWRHRVSTFQTLHRLFFSSTGTETAYNRLRRLRKADFVRVERTERKGKVIWCLGERGFRFLESVRLSDLKSKGYRPNSRTHDLLVMCALLGDWYKAAPDGVSVVTEQELVATEPSSIPLKTLESFRHRPDGLWVTNDGREASAVALEVEISVKSIARYEETCSFYGGFHFIENVIWIVPDRALARKIQALAAAGAMPREGQHLFVLLEDFEASLWNTRFLNPSLKNKSMSDFLSRRFKKPYRDPIEQPIDTLIERCPSAARASTISPLLDSSLSIARFDTYRKLRRLPNV
jgi:hypothetical protein